MKTFFQGITFSLSLTLLVGTGSAFAADPVSDFFNRDCVPEAKKSGLTQKEAQQGCTCTVNALRKKYSTQAFTALLSKYRGGDVAARRTLRSYGEPCFDAILDDILFEN